MKKDTENMSFAAQEEQALQTNSIKTKIDKQPVSPKYRLFGTKEETVMHYVVAPSWHINSTEEDMTMMPETFIGNCAKSIDWKAQTGDMSMHLLM